VAGGRGIVTAAKRCEGATVAEEAYYLDGSRNQQGPVPFAEMGRLIRGGTIRRDTLVWYAGMPEWRPAGQVSDFAALFAPAAPPPARPPAAGVLPPQAPRPAGQTPRFSAGAGDRIAPQSMAPQGMDVAPAGAGPTDALVSHLGVWGLFWRAVVAGVGNLVVIPAPWTNTMFYRYISEHTWLPSGRRLTFAGKAGDIWYVFIGIGLLGLLGQFFQGAVLITLPLTFCLNYLVFRWLCDKVGSEDGSVKLAFTGGFWGYLGWNLLVFVSFLTIIGWAWVLKFFLRWICRNISGTVNFDFVGTGWGILWRTVVTGLASIFLIPIPWVLRWLTAWFIGQVRTDEVATHFD
jgi:GYF domain 2